LDLLWSLFNESIGIEWDFYIILSLLGEDVFSYSVTVHTIILVVLCLGSCILRHPQLYISLSVYVNVTAA
jgi:hypothetical protein